MRHQWRSGNQWVKLTSKLEVDRENCWMELAARSGIVWPVHVHKRSFPWKWCPRSAPVSVPSQFLDVKNRHPNLKSLSDPQGQTCESFGTGRILIKYVKKRNREHSTALYNQEYFFFQILKIQWSRSKRRRFVLTSVRRICLSLTYFSYLLIEARLYVFAVVGHV